MQNKQQIKEILQHRKLICDGAFGTYYAQKYDTKELPETANALHPERVKEIHGEYLAAGAKIIRTNTYACNTMMLRQNKWQVKEVIKKGYALAQEAVSDSQAEGVYIAADIGPIPSENISEKEKKQLSSLIS